MRFKFGKNWKSYSRNINNETINVAQDSIKEFLKLDNLKGLKVLDAGCGSGIFSLASYNLGAKIIHSIDLDPICIETTKRLKEKFVNKIKDNWSINIKSILELNQKECYDYDIVYSWGVIHHTGNLDLAFDNLYKSVRIGGLLALSIYNDQGWLSKFWLIVKRIYNTNKLSMLLILLLFMPYFIFKSTITFLLLGKKQRRGMNIINNIIDWLGGYPFEVRSPYALIKYANKYNLKLIKINTVGNKHGCNEYLFRKYDEIVY